MPITISGSTGIAGVDGSASTPAVQGTDTNTGIFFPAADTIAFGEGGSEAMRIDSSGNVGIGTSSPNGKLDIKTASDSKLIVNDGSTAGNVRLEATNNAYSAYKPLELNGSVQLFATGGSERARIDSSGNLLVGTTTANGRISSVPKSGFNPGGTAGTWATSAAVSVSGAYGGGVSWIDGSGGYCAWVDDSGTDFNIAGNTTSGAVGNGVYLNGHAATSWSSRSDERLKQNIAIISDAIHKVCTLRAVTGEYKTFPGERQAFLFAQDVQKVLPEAVSVANKNDPEQPLGLAYTQIIPLLVAAIQELKADNDAMKERIATLEAK